MNGGVAPPHIEVWLFPHLRVELVHGRGVYRSLPRHSHPQFQIGVGVGVAGGVVHYRGSDHPCHDGVHCIVQAGEVHSATLGRGRRQPAAEARVMYADSSLLLGVAAELAGRPVGLPYFADFAPAGDRARDLFVLAHRSFTDGSSALERDTLLHAYLVCLIGGHGGEEPPPAAERDAAAVGRARAYLDVNFARTVLLADLSAYVRLGPYRLNRAFSRIVGLPPHAYQTQLRVERARAMLGEGTAIAVVAAATGFSDPPHLTRHFKCLVGVTPGRYRPRAGTLI